MNVEDYVRTRVERRTVTRAEWRALRQLERTRARPAPDVLSRYRKAAAVAVAGYRLMGVAFLRAWVNALKDELRETEAA